MTEIKSEDLGCPLRGNPDDPTTHIVPPPSPKGASDLRTKLASLPGINPKVTAPTEWEWGGGTEGMDEIRGSCGFTKQHFRLVIKMTPATRTPQNNGRFVVEPYWTD